MGADSRRRWPRWLLQVFVGVVIAGMALAGVIAVGNAARDSLGRPDRYQVAFADIECQSPPGMERAKFLGEVQYNGQFDDTVNVLEPALAEKLRTAFQRHRRVDKVVEVQIVPPKRIVVELKFRP